MGEATELQVGDVIRLDSRTSDSARVYVGDKPKYLGRPYMESDGELKLQLAGKIPPYLQCKYEVCRRSTAC